MRKFLNNPFVVGGLALAAIGLAALESGGFSSLTRPSAPAEVPADPLVEQDETLDPALPGLSLGELPAVDGLRDPFTSRRATAAPVLAEVQLAAPTPYHVSAIWMQGTAVLAVLNNRICRPGDTIDAVTIDSVTREGIWVRHALGREFIAVGRQILVTPAPAPLPTNRYLADAREG